MEVSKKPIASATCKSPWGSHLANVAIDFYADSVQLRFTFNIERRMLKDIPQNVIVNLDKELYPTSIMHVDNSQSRIFRRDFLRVYEHKVLDNGQPQELAIGHKSSIETIRANADIYRALQRGLDNLPAPERGKVTSYARFSAVFIGSIDGSRNARR